MILTITVDCPSLTKAPESSSELQNLLFAIGDEQIWGIVRIEKTEVVVE